MGGFADLDAVTRDAESVWAGDASVREEFLSKETYLAFRRAEARGQSRTVRSVATLSVKVPMQSPAPDQFDAEWGDNPELQAEFDGNKETYLAFRRAEAGGRVRTHAPGATPSQRSPAALPQTGGELAGKSNQDAPSLAQRQSQVRQENVGRQFAGLPVLPVPQQ